MIMFIDGHMHLENGPLSEEYAMKYIEAGIAAGMDCIQILDHTHRFIEFSPLYDKLKASAHQQKEWLERKKLESIQEYQKLIEIMKKKEFPIEVKWGLEVCYDPDQKEFLRDILQAYPYDFLIGSIHSVDGLLYDMKGFSREILWDKWNVNDVYKRYYEIMEDMIKSDLFTQIGHPDQVKLFHDYPDYDLHDTYERIAILAKQHDVFMECNTGIHYRYKHEDVGTAVDFMEILKKQQVKIMTASDAHQPEHVGMFIKEISST